jgi:hypothetical protein
MERDERNIVYAAVDRVGEQVIREHMHERTINICWDMFHIAMVKADLHHESIWGNGGIGPHMLSPSSNWI